MGQVVHWYTTLQKAFFYCIIFAKSETSLHLCYSLYEIHYNKICVKWPLPKRPKLGFQDQLSLNAGLKYCRMLQGKHQGEHSAILSTFINRGQKYFNIALVLQDEWLTIFTCPANTCTCPLKAYAIKNIRELCVIWLPRVILRKALVLQDKCFGKNYSSFLDFTHNYEQTSEIFVHWLSYHLSLRSLFCQYLSPFFHRYLLHSNF